MNANSLCSLLVIEAHLHTLAFRLLQTLGVPNLTGGTIAEFGFASHVVWSGTQPMLFRARWYNSGGIRMLVRLFSPPVTY